MPFPLDSILTALANFLIAYVEPYLTIVVIMGALLWIGIWLSGRARFNTARNAILGEVRLNLAICKSMIEYLEAQKVGNPYTIPMPRFYTTAFDNLRSQGYLYGLKKDLAKELITIYMTIDRIHAAGHRQEELAVGQAASSPIAADLRSQNLAFILGNVTNIVEPQLMRLDTYYGKR